LNRTLEGHEDSLEVDDEHYIPLKAEQRQNLKGTGVLKGQSRNKVRAEIVYRKTCLTGNDKNMLLDMRDRGEDEQ